MRLTLDKVVRFLNNRKPSAKQYWAMDITQKNTEFWAELWAEKGDEMQNHATAILIDSLEAGMPNKEYEKGFRDGLAKLLSLYSECKSVVELEARKAMKK